MQELLHIFRQLEFNERVKFRYKIGSIIGTNQHKTAQVIVFR